MPCCSDGLLSVILRQSSSHSSLCFVLMSRAVRCVPRFRFRYVCLIAILTVFWQQYLYHTYRNALAAKYSPTEFNTNVDYLQTLESRPDDETLRFQDDLLANRADWRALDKGWEGTTFLYGDSVIKTYTPGQSPFRNCAWGMVSEQWPTEIPASVLCGGFSQNHDLEPSIHNATLGLEGFLPVKAYFKASSWSNADEWHLVTPFVAEGSLKKFAKKISEEQRDYRPIDTQYRPVFNRLLHNLGKLHDAGYCHDDIKPENIFVRDESNWILGDLGQLRHISHPYHTSLTWRENKQLDDCRANDVVRLLKSYICFIQASANDKSVMNAELFDPSAPLSRLLWWTLSRSSSISTLELRDRSLIEQPKRSATTQVGEDIQLTALSTTRWGVHALDWGRRSAIDYVVDMRVSENRARWRGLVWVFGLPKSVECGE